jgi:hypothetical protein
MQEMLSLFNGRRALRKAVATAIAPAIGMAALAGLPQPGQAQEYTAQFNDAGELIRPDGWRDWVYVGAIATPNALNDGEAPFPEFHSTYIDPVSWEHWKRTGEFREGTMFAKELARVFSEDANPDGSTDQVSGTGYFMGEFSGFEISLKSKERYPDVPGNWAYFTYGHHAEPYSPAVAAMPAKACNACHEVSAADDFVFTQFYPVLRAADPK